MVEPEIDPVREDAYLKGLAAGRSERRLALQEERERNARLENALEHIRIGFEHLAEDTEHPAYKYAIAALEPERNPWGLISSWEALRGGEWICD